jgi:DNA mismatch repair protein MutH
MQPPGFFDYRVASRDEVLRRAATLAGRALANLVSGSQLSDLAARKGDVGMLVESYFGIPPNSRREADFPGAGIELKVAPLVRRGATLRSKERTVISMIDYGAIVNETWANAGLRKKLRILFVFYEHLEGRPKSDFTILRTHLWEPTGVIEQVIRRDWELLRLKVQQGRAHLLSESDGQILGPCTKARDSQVRVHQPITHLSPTAKPRAFALKPRFVNAIYQHARGSLAEMDSLLRGMRLTTPSSVEEQLRRRFARHIGKRTAEVAAEFGVGGGAGKSFAAGVVRAAFGATDPGSDKELGAAGLTVRSPRVSPELEPYESISFPAFDYNELLEEEWEDSDLLSHVEQMVFVPLIATSKQTPQADCRLGTPVFWRPSLEELGTMRREWEMYREEIRRGRADRLTPASQTQILHVRPHGRDSRDTRPAPGIGPVVKKSFWLNKRFVAALLARERAP